MKCKKSGLLPIFMFRLRQRVLVPCRDSGFSVATEFGLGRVSLVEIGVFRVMTECFSLGFLSR